MVGCEGERAEPAAVCSWRLGAVHAQAPGAPSPTTCQGWSPRLSSGGQVAVSMMVRAVRLLLLAARTICRRALPGLPPPPPPAAGVDRLAPLDCTVAPFVMAVRSPH